VIYLELKTRALQYATTSSRCRRAPVSPPATSNTQPAASAPAGRRERRTASGRDGATLGQRCVAPTAPEPVSTCSSATATCSKLSRPTRRRERQPRKDGAALGQRHAVPAAPEPGSPRPAAPVSPSPFLSGCSLSLSC
jgi:hypothetical protein